MSAAALAHRFGKWSSLVPVASPGVGARASSWCAGGVATWIGTAATSAATSKQLCAWWRQKMRATGADY